MASITVTVVVTDSQGNTAQAVASAVIGAAVANVKVFGDNVKIVAASGESQGVKDLADYVCDGVADEVQINQALADVGAEAIGYGTNGGEVVLVGRRFNVSSPVAVTSQSHLRGAYGSMGTWLYPSAGFSATGALTGVVQLASPSTQYARVSDLAINGQNVNTCGIYIGVALAQEWDAFIRLHDIYIVNTGQHGVRWDNLSGGRCRGNMAERIRVLNAGQSGFYINCPDSYYSMLDTGSSGSHGFYLAHSNGHFTNCKSWFSDGSGYYIAGGRDNHLSSCGAQDNQNHGFHIAAARNSFAACCADSNGYNGVKDAGQPTNLGSGFYVSGNGNNIQGTASDKNEGNRGARQQYPLQTAGAISLIANITASGNVNAAPSLSNLAAGSVVNVLSY